METWNGKRYLYYLQCVGHILHLPRMASAAQVIPAFVAIEFGFGGLFAIPVLTASAADILASASS